MLKSKRQARSVMCFVVKSKFSTKEIVIKEMRRRFCDAKKVLKAVMEFYSEDTPQVQAAKRVVKFLEQLTNE